MRVFLSAAAAVATLAAGAIVGAAAAAGSTSAGTQRVVVRPVTAHGHAAPGFTVHSESGRIDCSFPDPSPGAVDKNILECSPTAAYAVACWKSATAHHVLCLRDPRTKKLAKIGTTGRIASTAPARRNRAPLAVRLANGTYCTIRIGGSGPRLRDHPNWAVSYYCTRGAVWTPMNAPHYGINESHPVWTVHTAPASGNGTLRIRKIARAWFVGNR